LVASKQPSKQAAFNAYPMSVSGGSPHSRAPVTPTPQRKQTSGRSWYRRNLHSPPRPLEQRAKGVACPRLVRHHNNTTDGSVGFKENAPTQVGAGPPAAVAVDRWEGRDQPLKAPGGAVRPWACPMVPDPWWNYSKLRPSGCAVDILIHHQPSPPAPPPSGHTTAITLPPHAGLQPAPLVWPWSVSQLMRRVEPLQSAGRALPGPWTG